MVALINQELDLSSAAPAWGIPITRKPAGMIGGDGPNVWVFHVDLAMSAACPLPLIIAVKADIRDRQLSAKRRSTAACYSITVGAAEQRGGESQAQCLRGL
jgi:hypothetical protein